MILKTIEDREEFDALLNQYDRICFFIDSTWSGPSKAALPRFQKLADDYPDNVFVVIENGATESFIYAWLIEQQKTFEERNVNLKPRTNLWIHGNGEVIMVVKGYWEWITVLYNAPEGVKVLKQFLEKDTGG